jgi:hypothetical protein
MSWRDPGLAFMLLRCAYATEVADAAISLQASVMTNFTRDGTESFAGPDTEIARAEP